MEWARVGEDFAAVAVEAEAHAGLGLPGLDGDVARALAHRATKDFVQNPEEGFFPTHWASFSPAISGVSKRPGRPRSLRLSARPRSVQRWIAMASSISRREREHGAERHQGDRAEATDEVGVGGAAMATVRTPLGT